MLSVKTLPIAFAIIFHVAHSVLQKNDKETLVLTNVIFRHGDRAPDIGTSYPNNPYINASLYFPYTLGDLRKKGQARLFKVGKQLRKRYNSFLGKVYYTDLVSSVASSYPRVQMSLQSLHAGLFSTYVQSPIPGLSWQAIPYNIIPFADDKLISVHKPCIQILTNATFPTAIGELQELFDYVQLHSGFSTVTYLHMWYVHDSTKVAEEFGFAIPEWVKPLYPVLLSSLTTQYWGYIQEQKKRMGAGFLLKKITEDAVAKASGNLQPKDRKMFLYSGHDLNIHVMRGALNVWTPELVGYSAHILLELHNINGVHGFKVFFNNNYNAPKLLTIPGCASFCPLDQFIALTRHIYEPEPICE